MMINKDDRRGDSYLAVTRTSMLRLDDNNDEIAVGTLILWQVMTSEMAVVLVLRKFTYANNASICTYTAANAGGSNGSI
jgi:hypothetical protein